MLLPLAALAFFATSSIVSPASVLFRSIRRVVLPSPRAEVPTEDGTMVTKAANFLYTLFLRAFGSIVASVVQGSRPATLLPLFRDLGARPDPGTPITVSRSLHTEVFLVNSVAESKVEVVEPALISAVRDVEAAEPDATAVQAVPPLCPKHRTQRVTCVDFTIGWDDVWPQRQRCLPSPHVEYTFNSYFKAFTVSTPQKPRSPSPSSPHFSVDSDVDALELALRSADDDLLWAFHSLSISSTSPSGARSPCSALEPAPPAGLSPFCPPPLLTPNPPPPTTTWRLDWY
ncbi:hypothetical protein B0H12DRAFT_728032 [Mycena haematopus]|nr:hypothetical protein B0H12DRAFT_728032 [Mycena haematopus]